MERQNTTWIVEKLPKASYEVCAAPLTQHGTIVAVGNSGLCHLYSPRHRRWQGLPPMREEGRHACCVVRLGDEIVVAGGWNGRGSSDLSSVERLKLDDKGQPLGRWEAAPGMTQKRHNCAAVVADGKIVVVGGFHCSCLSSAEMFDPLENTWKRLPDMAAKRNSCAAVAIRDKIYVFGGGSYLNSKHKNSRLDSAEYLCMNTKKWHSLPPMRKRRIWPAAVAMGGRILVVGGRDEEGRNLSDVEVLDTSTMEWEEDHDVPSLNTGRYQHGATTVGNRIYVVGGWGDSAWLDTMEILEVQEAPQPDYSEFKTRIDFEAEVAVLRKQIQDGNDSFELNAITLAAQAKKLLPLLEELLKTMPTVQKLRSDISNLEEGIRGLRNKNRLKDAIPLARKRGELVEQLRKEEMAEGQKSLPRPLSDKPRQEDNRTKDKKIAEINATFAAIPEESEESKKAETKKKKMRRFLGFIRKADK